MPGSSKKPRKKYQVNQNLESSTKPTEEVEISSEEQERIRLEKQMLDNAAFLSVLMIDGAMRFRSVFVDEEIEANNKITNEINKQLNRDKPNGWESMAKRNVINNNVFKARQEKTNEALMSVIEAHTKNLSEQERKEFDGFVIGIKIMIEEFMEAKNSQEIITLVKLYNQGMLDGVFEKFKPKNDENNQNLNSNDSTIVGVQENNNTTGNGESTNANERAGNDGHIESGPLPNGDVRQGG